MTKLYCDSPIHKVSSLALAFIILAFCVLPVIAYADDVEPSPSPSPIHPNTPVGYQEGDTFRDILLVVLDSWGISFSRSNPNDETSILEYSDELMAQFYAENNVLQEEFWELVKYGADQTGNIILDFLGVNAIRQFANWLVDKFNLTNNASVSLSSSATYAYVGGTKCLVVSSPYETFFCNYAGQFPNDSSYYNIDLSYNEGVGTNFFPVYITTFINTSVQPNYSVPAFYFTAPTSEFRIDRFSDGQAVLQKYGGSAHNYYIYTVTNRLLSLPDIQPLIFDHWPTVTELFGDFSISQLPSQDSLIINTTIINIPSDNDITPDDGLQIEIPGTNWGDSINTILDIIERLIGLYDSTQLNINTVIELLSTLLQGLQQSVSVENIPGAVTLDYDDYDISLETDWSIVEGFFSDSEDSPFSALTAIIYGFPAPLILFFSVLVIFIIAYGFIRMGRDSH